MTTEQQTELVDALLELAELTGESFAFKPADLAPDPRDALIAKLTRLLRQAVDFVDYSQAYRGKSMNASEVEAARNAHALRVSRVEIAHWGPALAAFDIGEARDLVRP